MKKRITMIALCVALVAILAIGGTMAYFTDTDGAKNVMATGNVKIEQIEQQYKEVDGKRVFELETFEDNKPMFPVTEELFKYIDGKPSTTAAWGSNKYFPEDINAISKDIRVKNNGTEDAYIRSIILFEMGKLPAEGTAETEVKYNGKYQYVATDGSKWVHLVEEGRDAFIDGAVDEPMIDTWGYDLNPVYAANKVNGADVPAVVEIDGICYSVYQANYIYNNVDGKNSALEAGKTSYNSLYGFWLRQNVGNEFEELVDGEYNVLALSLATQMAGFDSVEEAMDAAFGNYGAVSNVEGTPLYRIVEDADPAKDGAALIAGWFEDVE